MKRLILSACFMAICIASKSQTLTLDSTTLNITIAVDSNKVTSPWDIEWGFDNRLWMTDAKTIKRWDPTTGTIKTMFSTYGYGLGLALPKTMPSSGPLYVYAVIDTSYYYANSGLFWLYRFEYDAAGDTLINPTILLTAPHAGEHSSGRVVIGADNKVWLGTPEYRYTNDTINALNGRVLRMNTDGSAATGNLRPDRTYSIGHRNSQGMVVLPDGKVITTEHSGPTQYDEINLITLGGHYGWPTFEGFNNCSGVIMDSCSSAALLATHKPPMYQGSMTPTGLDYYDHPAIPEWRNCLVVGTLYFPDTCLAIFKLNNMHDTVLSRRNYLKKNAGGINDFKRTRDICVAPDGSIYAIVRDRLINFPGGDTIVNQGTRIMKLKNNAYVPPVMTASQMLQRAIAVYPVPADGHINVTVNDDRLTMSPYRILDMTGRQMTAGTVAAGTMNINTTNWTPGIYQLIVDSREQVIRQRILIVH